MPEQSLPAILDTDPDIGATLTVEEKAALQEHAIKAVRSCTWLPAKQSTTARAIFQDKLEQLAKLERNIYAQKTQERSDDLQWLYDNLRLVRSDIQDLQDSTNILSKLPVVQTASNANIPRCVVLARSLLAAANNQLSEANFSYYIQAVQQLEPLRLAELEGMVPALKLALLELIADRGSKAFTAFERDGVTASSYNVGYIIRSLRFISEIEWKDILEPLSLVDLALRQDPVNVYPRMDYESRQNYRKVISRIAARSDVDEVELARIAVKKAKDAVIPPGTPAAVRDRLRHVGYYLVDDIGSADLLSDVSYRPSFSARIDRLFRKYPDEVYIIGIEFLTLVTVAALIMSIVQHHDATGLIIGALLLIVPATQAAVEVMNYLVTAVLTPRVLPKVDFTEEVDPNCATMVAVPTLLINDKQIHQLVDDMEIRYLVNRDPNIHFALLTDLPDSAGPASDDDPRIDLAIRLIEGLNTKYGDEPYGGFYLFHRHRMYNPREGAWMGFERKRGKLLDLNQYLRKAFDPFPVKAGDLVHLPNIRYVLTLDSDTALPRGTAQRMIGTMAHPLNQPIIDPDSNIVTQGYGILQPRVGISVQSASRSRLANIYSGQTGFDIYSRAISDVYQDLYGEGIFTGKGIYDVDALRKVLEHRFPRNALLSHDLIEGAYSRAGLVSDIEVIDDYPSHYSAYNRRKHRWLRGDWQIVRWIFNRVPDETRKLVSNPISLVSRWKIVDNLRRSLVEPALFLLLTAGWFFLPAGPRFWTLVTLALLFLPIYCRLIFSLIRATYIKTWLAFHDAITDFLTSHISIGLNICFLAHQAMVALDAIVRTVIRANITQRRLLEWETATEAELGIRKRTPVDVYLDWIPVLALALGACLFKRPQAAPWALPFLVAWFVSPLISKWLNLSPITEEKELSVKDRRFLREVALRTWRYYIEFSNEKNHWLIPDNVQEEPFQVAERVSPTNLGFLLNARQAAVEFGYLSLCEFIDLTEKTLASTAKLPQQFGHLLNWYDTLTLRPLDPAFVSSVDSGNLAASLWSLKQGCLEASRLPFIRRNVIDGLNDHAQLLSPDRRAVAIATKAENVKDDYGWISGALKVGIKPPPAAKRIKDSEQRWWSAQFAARLEALHGDVNRFTPWCLPEFDALRTVPKGDFEMPPALTPANVERFYDDLERRLQALETNGGVANDIPPLASKLRQLLPECRRQAQDVRVRLSQIAAMADQIVREMDFGAVASKRRKLLSIGYDVAGQSLNKSCYDLLASEARIATFIAVAKGEVPQENWFRLGRQHTLCEGENVLISWTGTMFEYLMGVIWMKSHPDTLLDRAVRSAVRAQQSYGEARRVPWGISESAFSQRDADGNYQYAAFGVPGLALNVARADTLVVSPYSSCLALLVDPKTAADNLREMNALGWLSTYGFYESTDYTGSTNRRFLKRKYKLAHCWMAHHQGMSLTALCNVFHEDVFQRWFHAEPLVQASELILQERPIRVKPITDAQPRRILSWGRTESKRTAQKAKATA